MLVTRTNDASYLKSLCLFVWRFFMSPWLDEEETEEENKPLIKKRWPLKPVTPLELCTDEEEEGVDRHFGNQCRRELTSLDENTTCLLYYT